MPDWSYASELGLSRRSPFARCISGIGEPSQPDDAGAMSLDQLVEYGHGLMLTTIEQRFRGGHEIGQSQAYQAIGASRLQQLSKPEADVGPHVRIIVQGRWKPSLFGCDAKAGVFQLDRERTGGETLHAQFVGQLFKEPMEDRLRMSGHMSGS